MSLRPKLQLMLARDAVYCALMLATFYLPSPLGVLLLTGAIFAGGKIVEPRIKADSERLNAGEKRIYFGFAAFFFLILLALLLRWIIRHSSPPAWAMGSLGIIVLLTLFYASYDSVYGRTQRSNDAVQLTTARLVFAIGVATNSYALPHSRSAVVTDLVSR